MRKPGAMGACVLTFLSYLCMCEARTAFAWCWLGKQELLPSMTGNPDYMSAAHAMLSVLAQNGADRVFLVPGESYLGLLDALSDFPQIDVVTCRHEAGAGFMACADGRLTRRPGVLMVSRGPGATNGSILLHLNSTHSPVKNQ